MKTYNIHHINQKINQKNNNDSKVKNEVSFDNILKDIENIKFSKHAKKRIDDRNISIDKKDVIKINNAINNAKAKGVRQALILMGNNAFIASVDKNTIITTMNAESMKNNVFTNIDGAVII